ncbi:MAG: ATP-dependent nuclease [Lachnospiraceae bacterium]
MQYQYLQIKNFKSIRSMEISNIENALILVGKNNTGKTSILDAVRAVSGCYQVREKDFNEKRQNIEIQVRLQITQEDLQVLHAHGVVSHYKRFDLWEKDFCTKLPSFQGDVLSFTCVINREGKVRYNDGKKKDNRYISMILPRVYYLDAERSVSQLQGDLLLFQDDDELKDMRVDNCIFDRAKKCNRCFSCMGLIQKKLPEELSLREAEKLLEYKFYQKNLNDFAQKVNENFRKNGGYPEKIEYRLTCSPNHLFQIVAESYHTERETRVPVEYLGKGMRSMYMLSLLEAWVEGKNRLPILILMEEPEIFLHPKLQKISGEALYRLAKKNQVIFSTHSPNLLFNFNTRQIRQIVLDEDCYSVMREKVKLDEILDDLGYSAGDLMNVSFVFIVEGKQDKSRLPLLLEHYYSELHDEQGRLSRIAIITTNSCTNIKTYANLKYINQLYLKDQFLMIRDGDGKDPEMLTRRLCKYYDERNQEDVDKLPRVTRKNVLILKYYSFENYFLNPKVMAQLGVISKESDFYRIFLKKWKSYLNRITSGQALKKAIRKDLQTVQDVKEHMEDIKIHMRGHNLYDIFYGRYKSDETELLRKYISIAPREDFADILDRIDSFVYFENRKKED